jgi:hypothetical protein
LLARSDLIHPGASSVVRADKEVELHLINEATTTNYTNHITSYSDNLRHDKLPYAENKIY